MSINLLKSANLWSHSCLGNLNEARNALSPCIFIKLLNSIFQSIIIHVGHTFFLHSYLVSVYFAVKLKKISIEISFNLRLLLRDESHINFHMQCVIMTLITWLPTPCYMCYFQILDKVGSFLKSVSNALDSKKGRLHLWRTGYFTYSCWLASFLFRCEF